MTAMPESLQASYRALQEHFATLGHLEDALGFLHWDASVMMPDGAAAARGEQLAGLATLHHGMLADPRVGDWLEAVDETALDPWQRANVAEMRRARAHAVAVPGDLVAALSRASTACEHAWRKARPAADFALVRPFLETVLGHVRDVAQAKAEALDVSPYDALLDEYEPGGSIARIEPLFADLEAFLPEFIATVIDRQGAAPPAPSGPFPADKQQALARRLMEAVGFDFAHGRLDTSAHPFCGGTPDDVRITTRYDEADFTQAIMGVLHETGHGLYERGLPAAWRGQPVGKARGMSVHESQSLLIEMQACRSAEFLAFAAPLMAEAFGGSGPAWEADSLYKRAIRVERGFIRVDADEVTYPAHVILRTKLERAMIAGELEVADLPGAWNEGFRKLLGVEVPDDRLGCLQDIHWYDGAWGYFPTYTLGAMTAAQVFAAAVKAVPEIPQAIARGDFSPLVAWLRDTVHAKASSLPTDALLTQVTGSPLDAVVFKAHLKRRYLGE